MNPGLKNFLSVTGIILLFGILLLLVWWWYARQLEELDQEKRLRYKAGYSISENFKTENKYLKTLTL